jgi:hypothetical protein
MIGTTRSRVSYFMNRFRDLGLIDYKDRIHVHKSLLNVILHDQLPYSKAEQPSIRTLPGSHTKPVNGSFANSVLN